MAKTAAERAEAGAKFLDEKQPGWAAIIDLNSLNVGNDWECPACQVMDINYDNACKSLGLDPFGARAIALGFYPGISQDPSNPEWDAEAALLTEAWKLQIEKRVLVPA